MQFAALHQASRDVGLLNRCAFGRRMRRKMTGNRNENVSTSSMSPHTVNCRTLAASI
jgi:hypothetical protein